MYQVSSVGALLTGALCVCVSISAQEPSAQATNESSFLRLRYEQFDPAVAQPALPASLESKGAERLWIVQFDGTPTQAGRDGLSQAGAEIHTYLPDNAYVVRMGQNLVAQVGAQPMVRSVSRYHAAYRLEPVLVTLLQSGDLESAPYNMVVVDKHNDKPALAAAIAAMGGVVEDQHEGSLLFTVTLTADQLVQAAHLDQVLWIDRWTPIELDVNNARLQGGANYVESQGGYTGQGVNTHIYEGILANHQAYNPPAQNVLSSGASTSHGTSTAGIVFGDGTGNPTFRGFAPDTGKYYTNYSSVQGSRWSVVNALVNTHNVSHTTASWGNTRTTQYTSISADADDIIFDHNIPWTQSQSNAGNSNSRPQAWAKNIFSIGGFAHYNNSSPNDDSWQGGGGSTGPGADGRIKPTLAAYYDNIGTTSSNGGYTTSFGGTSGATPIVAGHNTLVIDMFTDDQGGGIGLFGNTLRNPGGSDHSNRPHFTTLKCLQVANSYKYTPSASNNRRRHVGWGYPQLQNIWDNRNKTLVIDEEVVLTQGQVSSWDVNVAPGEAAFAAVLNYAEPAANPGANPTLINNLSLRVSSPSGAVYWGNHNLDDNDLSNWSIPGGSEDNINPIECVFVQNPQVGVWTIDVIATAIVQDNHIETPAVDADYGLVVTGGTGQPSTAAFFSKYGVGCPGTPFTVTPCVELNPAGGTLLGTQNPLEYGLLSSGGPMTVESFDVYMQSTGGTQVIPAHIYPILGTTPLGSTTISVGATPGFYRATFTPPVVVTSGIFIAVDLSAQTVIAPLLNSGTTGAFWTRAPGASSWSFSFGTNYPSFSVACTSGTVFDVPTLGNTGSPVLGTSYDVTLSDAVASSAAILITGLSDTIYNGTPLPAPIPGAPGCDIQAAPDTTLFTLTSASGTSTSSVAVPNDPNFIGLELFHQWAVLDAANAIGIIVSDAGKGRVGT